MSSNFQFSLYLKESGLSEQECSDLERIFSTLRPERKVEVMEEWPRYLNKIFEIKRYADAERKRNIFEAFARIEALLDDASLRRQEAERTAALTAAERKQELLGAEQFDAERRLAAMKRLGRNEPWNRATVPIEEERPMADPLSQFL